MKKLLAALLLAPILALAQYAPITKSTTLSPTFTWTAIAGTVNYRLYITQNKPSGMPNAFITPAQSNCPTNTGTCSYTPAASTFPIPLVKGHYTNWWIEAYDGSSNLLYSPGKLQFWTDDRSTTTNDFNVDYIDTFEGTSCNWRYVTDFNGQSRRLIDLYLTYTSGVIDNGSYGYYAFPENQFSTVDISDLIPSGVNVRAILMNFGLISSASCSSNYCDLLGFSFRRNGSTALNIPAAPLLYTVSARTPMQVTVPVNNNKFDFLWSHVVNNIDVAATNGSTVTGRALGASMVGYCSVP